MIPATPTPEWALSRMKQIVDKYDDYELTKATLELLASAVGPETEQNKHRYESTWAAIEYGYSKTEHMRRSCREFLGAA